MKINDTELRLEQALKRLIAGKPINTQNDGRINIKRINDEAKLADRNIYYYKDFLEEAKKTIKKWKNDAQDAVNERIENEEESTQDLQVLKEKVKQQTRLKEQYRAQRNDAKTAQDQLVIENVSLAFRVLELEDENRHLTKQNGKVVSFKNK